MANTRYLRCSKCGNDAFPTKAVIDGGKLIKQAEVGTSTMMRCKDCTTPKEKPYATMCRQCCPTNHGTFCYQNGIETLYNELK